MKLQLRLPALTKLNQINQDWNLQFHFKYTVCSPVKTKYTHKNGRSSQNLLIKGTRLTEHLKAEILLFQFSGLTRSDVC